MSDDDPAPHLGPSPWPLFADEDEPWTDLDRLLRLDEKFDYQYEIAHVLGTYPGKISHWMGKAKAYEQEQALKAGRLCVRCEENETPGGEATGNEYCEDCMDAVRANGRGHEVKV